MLNEQAFKVLQSQNLLDLQAEKELNEALGSITNYNWHCGYIRNLWKKLAFLMGSQNER